MTDQHQPAASDVLGVLEEARRLTVIVRKRANPLLAEYGLTIAGRLLLAFLDATGPATVPQLAAHALMTRQVTQRLVDDLTRAGFVERRPNPDHRRSLHYRLTDAGRDALAQATAAEERVLADLCHDVTPADLARCRETLERLGDSLLVDRTDR